MAAVIDNEMLDEILAQVRPLLGRVRLPITFPRWPRSAVISSASPFVLSTGSVFRRETRWSDFPFSRSQGLASLPPCASMTSRRSGSGWAKIRPVSR